MTLTHKMHELFIDAQLVITGTLQAVPALNAFLQERQCHTTNHIQYQQLLLLATYRQELLFLTQKASGHTQTTVIIVTKKRPNGRFLFLYNKIH